MRQLKFVFTKSRKTLPIFSWLIMLWTWKSYSHIALEVKIPYLKGPMYFQSNEGKVNYEYYDHFIKEHKIIKEYTIEIPEEIYSDMKIQRLMSAGTNYGLMQNVGIVLVDIFKWFNISIKNPWKKGQNCSELIYKTVLKPLNNSLNHDPDTIKPHHIERIILNNFKTL